MKALMTLAEFSAELPRGFGVKTLRKAIEQTDPEGFPPPLRAKAKLNRNSKTVREYLITAEDGKAFIDSLPDA